MHKTSIFGLSVLALSASGWISAASAQAPAPPDATPPAADAPAPAAKPMKHMKMKYKEPIRRGKNGKLIGTKEGDAMVEDLNTKSLAAAKAGQTYTPPGK